MYEALGAHPIVQKAPFCNQADTTLLQSCAGISFKSQALYLIVYVTRYLGKLPLTPANRS